MGQQSKSEKVTPGAIVVKAAQRKGSDQPTQNVSALQAAVSETSQANPAALTALQRTYGNQAVQRMLSESSERSASTSGGEMSPGLEQDIRSARGSGHPLDERSGAQMGRALGADLSGVKVHTDARAERLNRSLNAEAFTLGRDIFFSRGAYQPRSASGGRLLAHELTHVVQQGGYSNKAQTKLRVGPTNDAYEQEAEWVAARSGGGEAPMPLGRSGERAQRAGIIQRKGKKKKPVDPTAGMTPADAIATIEKGLAPNFEPLSDEAPAKYAITVAVAQGLPEYLRFAKKRMRSTIRNKVRAYVRNEKKDSSGNVTESSKSGFRRALAGSIGSGMRQAKSSKEVKEKAARKASPMENDPNATDPQKAAAIKRIIDNSDSVGHSWIKFTALDKDEDIITTYSFGFIPQTKPTNPQGSVPGLVRNPDVEFENDSNRRYVSSEATPANYLKGLRKAINLATAPPNYSTIGYNCTKFVKDVGVAAGVKIPGNIGLMMPISSRGLLKQALNPNKLYEELGKNQAAVGDSVESEMIEEGYEQNDQGTLMSSEDVARSMTSADVVRFLERMKYVVSMINRQGRAKWEEEGLHDFNLQSLSRAELENLVYREDIDMFSIFTVFGLPTTNVPRGRGHGPRPAWDRF